MLSVGLGAVVFTIFAIIFVVLDLCLCPPGLKVFAATTVRAKWDLPEAQKLDVGVLFRIEQK